MTYNRLMQGLKLAGVEVDRKVLADLAVNDAPPSPRSSRSPGRLCRPTSTRPRGLRTPLPDADPSPRPGPRGSRRYGAAPALGPRGRAPVRRRGPAGGPRGAARRCSSCTPTPTAPSGTPTCRPRRPARSSPVSRDGPRRAGRDRHAAGLLGRRAAARRRRSRGLPARRGWSRLLEALNDPGNAGTVIRTADAAGADAVVLTAGTSTRTTASASAPPPEPVAPAGRLRRRPLLEAVAAPCARRAAGAGHHRRRRATTSTTCRRRRARRARPPGCSATRRRAARRGPGGGRPDRSGSRCTAGRSPSTSPRPPRLPLRLGARAAP